jgi:outer membrane lipoprotein SlyB
MRKFLLVLALAFSCAAQAAPMTNDDVIKLVRSGVGDSLVMQTIDASEPMFDTSVDGIIRLKQGGVSDTVIQKMMSKKTAVAPAPVPSGQPMAPGTCRECGVIEFVREVERGGQAGGTGAVAGGVAGAVVGRGVSNDRNRTFGTIAGAVGGALAGHQIEKHVKTNRFWEIAVRFDDGTARAFQQEQQPLWRQGDRVRVVNGVVGPL